MCVYVYVCVLVKVRVCERVRACDCVGVEIFVFVCVYVNVYVCLYLRVCIIVFIYMNLHKIRIGLPNRKSRQRGSNEATTPCIMSFDEGC